jgi:predicted acetyltransferase
MTDLSDRFRTAPVDETSQRAFAARGFEARLVPASDPGFPDWLRAVRRGFLDSDPTDEQVAATEERGADRRNTGVYDPAGAMPGIPVGTVASWGSELSVPGGVGIPVSAISAVTVAPTHHRRGIARAMLEGELRAAASVGLAASVLTVSESTLYGRYGFAPAAAGASWRIEARRAGWVGEEPTGRVDFTPGESDLPSGHWDRFARTRPDSEKPGALRAVQWTSESGGIDGLALYTVAENHEDYTKSKAEISYLLAASPQAYAALWRFFLTLDLIGEVTASELSTDEPLLWMIADQRAATVTVTDHQYVRVIDVPAALEARRYSAAGVLALDVHDPIGLSTGRWVLEVDGDGSGRVRVWDGDAAPAGAVVVTLGIAELSALYLGGVSPVALERAGRLSTTDAETAARVLGWPVTPRLSFWY